MSDLAQLTLMRPPAAQGFVWIKTGWQLFKHAPVPWAGMTALVFLILMGVGAIPHLGPIILHALSPFVVAGFLAASRAAKQGEVVNFLYLGHGFRESLQGLLLLGVAYMVCMFLIFKLVAFFTGGDLGLLTKQIENPNQLTPQEAEMLLQGIMPSLLLGSLFLVPLLMATWFSPGLILFESFPPAKAAWWSGWACLVNWRPILVYSLSLSVMGMIALMIPLGLGLLIFIPWTLTSTYAAYEDIFGKVTSE